ncbi:MAG: hypothetical protein QMD12_03420 [Candidatus Aenigmarchaeota archaeon]|nr:hypothetical protein [Candidatus Aenigmarchaeota archaeon]
MAQEKASADSIQDFLEKTEEFCDRKMKLALYIAKGEGTTNYCLLLEADHVLYDRSFPTEKRTLDDLTLYFYVRHAERSSPQKEREHHIMLSNDLAKNFREMGYDVEEVPVVEFRSKLPKEMSDEDLIYFLKLAHIKGALS